MGMLTEEEMVVALINNLDDKDWIVNPTYPLDEEYGKVVVKALKEFREKHYGHA